VCAPSKEDLEDWCKGKPASQQARAREPCLPACMCVCVILRALVLLLDTPPLSRLSPPPPHT